MSVRTNPHARVSHTSPLRVHCMRVRRQTLVNGGLNEIAGDTGAHVSQEKSNVIIGERVVPFQQRGEREEEVRLRF